MELWPHQFNGVKGVQGLFAQAIRAVLLVMHMGTGKTATASKMVEMTIKNNKRALFIAHRYELIEQAAQRFIDDGMDPGIIMAGFNEHREKRLQVASIQTLNRRDLPEADLIIVDEAHRSISKEYMKILKKYYDNGAYFVGLTATPFRTNKKEAFKVFWQGFYQPITVAQAIQDGYICQSKQYACARIVTKSMAKSKGDFDEKELMKAFDVDNVYVNLVANYNRLIGRNKAIVFCVNVQHSMKTCEVLKAEGYRAVHVDGTTPKAQRKQIVEDFKAGLLDVLTNVDIFTEGFDCPDIMAVVLNMATTSKAKYFQAAGRGCRIVRGMNKTEYKILDMADNVKRFGAPEDDFIISLEPQSSYEGGGVAPKKDCPYCGYIMHASAKKCPECGKEMPVKVKKRNIKEEQFVEITKKKIDVKPYLDYPKARWHEIPSDLLPAFASENNYSSKWVKIQLAARGEGRKIVSIKGYEGRPDYHAKCNWLQKCYYENIPIDLHLWGAPRITSTELIFEYKLEKQEAN